MANAKKTKKKFGENNTVKKRRCSRKCTIPKIEYVIKATNKKPEWYILYGARVLFSPINQKAVDDGDIYPIAYVYTNTYVSTLDALRMATRGRIKTHEDRLKYQDRRDLDVINLVDIASYKIPMNLMRCER